VSSKTIIKISVVSTAIVLLSILAISRHILLYNWHLYRLGSVEEYSKREAIIESFTRNVEANPSLANHILASLLDDNTLFAYKPLLARFLFIVPRPDLVEEALKEYDRRNDPSDAPMVFELGIGAFDNSMDQLGWRAYLLQKKYAIASKGDTIPYATTVLTAAPKEDIGRIVDELRELSPYVPRNTEIVIGGSLQNLMEAGKTSITVGQIPANPSRHYYKTLYDAVMTSGVKLKPLL
jgi:hypothetical protein